MALAVVGGIVIGMGFAVGLGLAWALGYDTGYTSGRKVQDSVDESRRWRGEA